MEGGVATVWTGSALNVCSDKVEISLLHSRFNNGTEQKSCGNGSIVGQDVGVDNNTYTSRVNISASCELNGTTIQCFQDNGVATNMIGNSTIIGELIGGGGQMM